MSFLSPLVLGGLAAIGVPVLIHLFNKFRVRTTDWGAMRFLLDSVQKNQKRVKMDDLLLMILRCLVVALAVFAFARPVLKGLGQGSDSGGPIAAAVILDHSASMAQGSGAVNRFDRAKEEIRTWLGQQDSQSLVALYLGGTRTTPLIGKPANDFGLFRKSLDEARVSDYGSDLHQSLRMAVESLKTVTGRPKEIRLYTDGQASAFLHREEMKKLAQEYPDIVIRPIVIGEAAEPNLGLVTLRPEGGVVSVGQPARFRVEVMNSGPETARGVTINFTTDDGSPAGSANIPVIAAGETQGVAVTLNFATGGPHRVTASLAADAFAPDNQRSAAVDVASRMEVVIAETDPGEGSRDQGAFFLSRALVPVPKDQASRYYLAPTSVRIADLPATLSQKGANRPAVVFLCDPGVLPAEVAAALESYVKSGGNLAVFPGAGTDVVGWSSQEAFARLLPGSLAVAVESTPEVPPKAWQSNGFSHPVTSLWNDPANGNLGTVKFSRYCPLTLKTTGSPSVIAAFADGQPAVAEWSYGQGTVVLFSASESQDWTNHPLHPSFVPFLQRLMGFFNRKNEARLILSPGEAFRKPLDEAFRGKDFSIQRPGTDAARTAGQVMEDGAGAYLRYAATDRAGAYQVSVGPDPIATFAVQMDPAESDLRMVDPAVLTALSDIPRDAAGSTARTVVLKEYWPLLIWCMAAFFVIEAVMAHRISLARSA